MNTITAIEKAHYLATPDDVEKMAHEAYTANSQAVRAAGTYFRVLLATIQADVVGKPVLRAPRGPSGAVDTAAHLAALEAAHGTLYEAVLRGVVTPDVATAPNAGQEEQTRRAKERNRRTTYARTAASTLRRFIRSGGDIRRLVVTSVSKTQVASMIPGPEGAAPEENGKKRILRAAARLSSLVATMAAGDRSAALGALQEAMPTITSLFGELGGKATTSQAQSVRDHRLLRTPDGIFWPVETRTQ